MSFNKHIKKIKFIYKCRFEIRYRYKAFIIRCKFNTFRFIAWYGTYWHFLKTLTFENWLIYTLCINIQQKYWYLIESNSFSLVQRKWFLPCLNYLIKASTYVSLKWFPCSLVRVTLTCTAVCMRTNKTCTAKNAGKHKTKYSVFTSSMYSISLSG